MIVMFWKRAVSDLAISAFGSFGLDDFDSSRFGRGSFRPNSVGRFGQSFKSPQYGMIRWSKVI